MQLDDKLATMLTADLRLARTEAAPAAKSAGPRTALLLRCSAEEGSRIRAAAKRRGATIAGFVLHALRIAWGAPP